MPGVVTMIKDLIVRAQFDTDFPDINELRSRAKWP